MKLSEVHSTYESDQAFVSAVDKELRRIMEDQPEFIYQPDTANYTCSYQRGPANDPNRCSGCVFGQAFRSIGVTDLTELDTCGNCGIHGVVLDFCDFEAPEYWQDVQESQDMGASWGECLECLLEDSTQST